MRASAATEVVTDAVAFNSLRDEWNGLVHASRSPTPFLTWEWMQAWWTHLGQAARLHLVTVRSGGELVGLAPLMVRRRKLALTSRLEFLGTGGAGSDYLDVIVRPGHEETVVDACARALTAERAAAHFDHLPPASMVERIHPGLASSGWTALDSSPDVCPYIDLTGHTFESYLATLGASHRANFRRRLRSLHGRFDVRFKRMAFEAERRRALCELIRFHDERWRRRGGSTAFATPALRAFHAEVMQRAHAGGWLRCYELALNGTPVAVMYGFSMKGRFYFYQHGFAGACIQHGIGLVLMGLTIRDAIDEGCTEFDMLYGHEAYKYLWARAERRLGRLQLFPPRLSGRLLQRQAETRRAIGSLVRQIGLRRSYGHS